MIILVTGGSGCGKSTWAEKLVQSLPSGKRVYIATMQVFDRESEIRVQRHRAQRAGLGFRTIECEKDLASDGADPGEAHRFQAVRRLFERLARGFGVEQDVIFTERYDLDHIPNAFVWPG